MIDEAAAQHEFIHLFFSRSRFPMTQKPPRSACQPPEKWFRGDGSVVACTEKVKVLEENWAELREQLQEALDDAILMGCTASQVKAEFKRLVDELPVRYAEQDGAGRDDR
jgi:hypothetical protein